MTAAERWDARVDEALAVYDRAIDEQRWEEARVAAARVVRCMDIARGLRMTAGALSSQ
ncbi:hypothetical protein [Actinoalloteichus hymeniacidonis]|uniref:Uncharacterized protein n=1 Tax=Actinoalloteichus hymeniacidonis TaxID=340345 RepID=A0AAC9MZY9_9PSEU|nr:hypothetical protein [Actinoalloteichus hymeniacidonis]AOS65009.1 hypothetical protein TL08_21095 [Actinoalloteichus hymeniacidonis]MBB5906914.1 hypothetical protein [Actinoalloteichus hymeniacidonis]